MGPDTSANHFGVLNEFSLLLLDLVLLESVVKVGSGDRGGRGPSRLFGESLWEEPHLHRSPRLSQLDDLRYLLFTVDARGRVPKDQLPEDDLGTADVRVDGRASSTFKPWCSCS